MTGQRRRGRPAHHAVHPGNHHLHVPGRSVVHRLAPEAKLVGLVVFVVIVAITPRRAVATFGIDAVVVTAAVVAAGIPIGVIVRRLSVTVPFLAFAVLVPFVAGGEQVDVLGASLSVDGLWSTWNILAKALLGATASIVLSATTPVPDVLVGLSRLRVPRVLVAIVAFMFRYLDLLIDQLHRMRLAMSARGHDPRWFWQARPIASSAGVLFVRSFERGERIHDAMLARGFTGTMPEPAAPSSSISARSAWSASLLPGAAAMMALVLGVVWW